MQRITDRELQKICDDLGLELRQVTPYQLRVVDLLDFYPKRNRYFLLQQKTWGTAKDRNNLELTIAKLLPQLNETPIEKFKTWYIQLLEVEQTERIQGQLTMITSVLKVLLSEQEFNEFTKD